MTADTHIVPPLLPSHTDSCASLLRGAGAGYDLENWHGYDRSSYNANITDQDLVESYLPSFEACVNDAHVQSVMCSYNVTPSPLFLIHPLVLLAHPSPSALLLTSVMVSAVSTVWCTVLQAVNGIPSCANRFFLQTILRERFHFDPSAFVTTRRSTPTPHSNVAHSRERPSHLLPLLRVPCPCAGGV